jgi:UDP:flavonoid glycosyltransferase YjiC (YdhE family)
MVSGRFLFVTWDGGGNTAPTYPLVRRLAARGHAVTVLGQAAQGPAARELGAQFVPLPVPDWTPGKAAEDEMDLLGSLVFGPAAGEAVLDHLERHATDVVVVDCMLSSSLAAAERSAISSAAIVHILYQPFVGDGFMGRMWGPMLPMINQTRKHLGLPPAESSAGLLDPMNVVLVTCPQEFDVPMPVLPKNVRYVGVVFENAPRLSSDMESRKEDKQPRVLVAFSTTLQHQENTLRRVSAALSTLPVEATITVGQAVDPDIIDPAPNVAIQRYVPHASLLPDCALVVTHAGMGTVMASLAHGVPLLCMPMGREQHDNAARVAACGAGTVLAADAGVEEIRNAIQQMIATTDYQVGAKRMAATIARQNGRDTAVNELDALTRQPPDPARRGGDPRRIAENR